MESGYLRSKENQTKIEHVYWETWQDTLKVTQIHMHHTLSGFNTTSTLTHNESVCPKL